MTVSPQIYNKVIVGQNTLTLDFCFEDLCLQEIMKHDKESLLNLNII